MRNLKGYLRIFVGIAVSEYMFLGAPDGGCSRGTGAAEGTVIPYSSCTEVNGTVPIVIPNGQLRSKAGPAGSTVILNLV